MKFFNTTRRKEAMLLVLTFALLITAMFVSDTTLTGFVTQSTTEMNFYEIDEEFEESEVKNLQLVNVTSIRLKGTFEGEEGDAMSVSVRTSDNEVLLVDEIILKEETASISPFTARVVDTPRTQEETEEETEETNEKVDNEDADEEVDGEEAEENNEEVDDEEPEEIEDDVDGADQNVDDEEPEEETEEPIDEPEEETEEETEILVFEFDNSCKETCVLGDVEIVEIIIDINGGVFSFEGINYESIKESTDESLKKEVSDITIAVDEKVTLIASEFFEGENLIFDAKSSEGYSFEVDGEEITFTGQEEGTWSSLLYALDDGSLIISNEFNVIVLEEVEEPIDEPEAPEEDIEEEPEEDPVDEPEEPIDEPEVPELPENETDTNETITIPENETEENVTVPAPENETVTIPENETGEVDCTHPDPNKRPLECLQQENTTYFPREMIKIEDKTSKVVGVFTPIGNLMIRGDFVEFSSDEPRSNDYQLGYVEEGDFVPTIWINSETGDLHLRGRLVEFNDNLNFELGKYAISNRRNIILAIMDREQGNMDIRGNIIPYRRSLE